MSHINQIFKEKSIPDERCQKNALILDDEIKSRYLTQQIARFFLKKKKIRKKASIYSDTSRYLNDFAERSHHNNNSLYKGKFPMYT